MTTQIQERKEQTKWKNIFNIFSTPKMYNGLLFPLDHWCAFPAESNLWSIVDRTEQFRSWSIRSSDLISFDYFLWGHIMIMVYEAPLSKLRDVLHASWHFLGYSIFAVYVRSSMCLDWCLHYWPGIVQLRQENVSDLALLCDFPLSGCTLASPETLLLLCYTVYIFKHDWFMHFI